MSAFNWRAAGTYVAGMFAVFAYAGLIVALYANYGEWALIAGLGSIVVFGAVAAGLCT